MADISIDVKRLTDGFSGLTKAIENLDKRLDGLPKASTSALDLALGTPKSLDSYITSISKLDKAVGKSFSSIVRELRLFTVASQKATTSGFSALAGALESIIKIADSLSFGSTGAINTELIFQKLWALREVGDIIADFGNNVNFDSKKAISTSQKIKTGTKNLREAYDAIYNMTRDTADSPIDIADIDAYANVMRAFTKAFGSNLFTKYANIFDRINDNPINYEESYKQLRGFAKSVGDIHKLLVVTTAFTGRKLQGDALGTNTLDEIDMFSKFVKRFVRNMTNIVKDTDIAKLRGLEMGVRGIVNAVIGIFDFFENNPSLRTGALHFEGLAELNLDPLSQYIDKVAKLIKRLTRSLPKDIKPEKMKAVSIMFRSMVDSFPQILKNVTDMESMWSAVKFKKTGFPISLSIFAKPNQLLKRLRFFSVLSTYVKSMSKLSLGIPNKEAMKMTAGSLQGFAGGFQKLQESIGDIETLNVVKNLNNLAKIELAVAQLRRFFRAIVAWNIRTNDANKVSIVASSMNSMVDAVKKIGDVLETMTPVLSIMEKFAAYNRRVRFLGVIRVIVKDMLGIINKIASSLKERPDELVNRLKGFALAIKNLGAGIRGIILAQQEIQGMFESVAPGKGLLGRTKAGVQNLFSFTTNAIADVAKGATGGKLNLNFIRTNKAGIGALLKQFEPMLKVIEQFAKRLGKITGNLKDIEKITELTRALSSIKRFLEFVNTIDIDTRGRVKRVTDSVRSGFGLFSRQNKNNLFGQAEQAVKALKPFTNIVKQLKGINAGVIKEFFGFISNLHKMIASGKFNFDFSQAKMSGFDTWAKNFSKQIEGGVKALARMNINAKQIEKAKLAMQIAQSGMMDVNARTGLKARIPTLMPMADNDFLTENDAVRRGFLQRAGEMRRDFLQDIINRFTKTSIDALVFANPFSIVRNLQTQILTVFRDSGKIIGEYANSVAQGAQNMMRAFNPTRILNSQGFKLAVDYDALSSQLKVFGALNEEQLALAQQMANEIGIKYPLSANEALAATLDLLKAGQDLSKVQFILPASADLAALSESGDLQNVTKFLIGAANGYREFGDGVASSFDNITMATDIVFRAANDSTAGVDSLMEGLLRAAPSASAFGLSLEETAALLTVFEDAGIRGQEAGTQLRAVLDEMTMAGMNSREALDMVLSGTTPSGLFGERFERQGLRILQSATAQGKGIDALVARYQEMGTASEASSALMDNLSGDIEQLKGSFETALTVAFVPTLERFFRPIVKAMRFAVDAFTGMNPVLRDTIVNGTLVTVMGISMLATITFLTAKIVALSGWFMHLVGGMGLTIMKAPMLIMSLGGIASSLAVLASGLAVISGGFMFLSDAITQTFTAIEKNTAGAGDAFRNFASQTKVAFNEVTKLFGRVKTAYKTVFEKDDAKALQERGEVVAGFFSNLSTKMADFINKIRNISTVDILAFLENMKSRFGVIRGIFQDLRVGWMGMITGQEMYAGRLRVGLSKILYSLTDFAQRTLKLDLSESLDLFRRGEILAGLRVNASRFIGSLRQSIVNNAKRLGDVGEFIFNSLNPFKRLETGLRLFGQKDLANELKVINDQFANGFRGIVQTIVNIMGGKGLLESIRLGFGVQAAEFVKQSISVFQQLANGIGEALRQLGITLSFNPLRGLFDTLKTIPFNLIQSLIDSFKALGKVTLTALGGDMGAIAKVAGLSAAVITLVGPRVLGKFSGVFQTLQKFAKWLVIFEVIEAVTKNLDTLLNKNFFEGLTSVLADLSIGLLELLGLDEASLAKVRSMFDDIGVMVQGFVAGVDRMITDLIMGLEDAFPAIFAPSERTKQARANRETIKNIQATAYSDVGEQAVEQGFGNMLRKVGVGEDLISALTLDLREAAKTAGESDDVSSLFNFFLDTYKQLQGLGISEADLAPFTTLYQTFSERLTNESLGGNLRNILSGGEFANTVGRQNAVLAYGRELAGTPQMSVQQQLAGLAGVAQTTPGEVLMNRDLSQRILNELSGAGLQNLTETQATQALQVVSASGDDMISQWIPAFLDAGFGELLPAIFDAKTLAPYISDVFSQASDLIDYKDSPFMFAEGTFLENLKRIAKTETELNVTVPEDVIREQVFNGLKAGGEDFTKETLLFADMVRGVDTSASTYSAEEAVKLLDSLANAATDTERASLLAGKTIEQVIAEAVASLETSPELQKQKSLLEANIAKLVPTDTVAGRQKQSAALAVLYGGTSRFTGESQTAPTEDMFAPMEITTNSRKGLIELYKTVRAMTPSQVANNFQAIARNLEDMGIFADENSDILGLFLGQLQSIYETNPELGDMSQAFGTLQSNIDIANKTLEQMGITVDSPTYREELTKLLQQLGSLDAMGNIVIPITVTADAENLVGGLTPEEIQRMTDLGNLIDDYTQILAGTTDGVIEAEKTVDDLIKEYSDGVKSLEQKTIDTQNELNNMRSEFAESEKDAVDSYNQERKRALEDHLKEMKSIGDNDFKDAVANRNAAQAIEAMQRQQEAKTQFDENEKRAQEDFNAERQKALNEYTLKQQAAQNELNLERQKLEALRIQRDNALRVQLAQYQQEYNALVAKTNATAQTNNQLVSNTQTTMQQVATTIAGQLNNALRAVQSTPIGQAFGNLMNNILSSIQAAQIHNNIVRQGGFSGNQYNQPELNPNKGVIVIPPSYGGGRADGGKLMANRWYMTGEDGPEPLFMGNRAGYIATMKDVMNYQRPQRAMSSGGVNVNVDLSNMQISGVQNAQDIAKQVEERVVRGITQAFRRV